MVDLLEKLCAHCNPKTYGKNVEADFFLLISDQLYESFQVNRLNDHFCQYHSPEKDRQNIKDIGH